MNLNNFNNRAEAFTQTNLAIMKQYCVREATIMSAIKKIMRQSFFKILIKKKLI